VGVVDEHLGGSGFIGAEDGCVGVAGHEHTTALVVGPLREHVLGVGDPGDALHVD